MLVATGFFSFKAASRITVNISRSISVANSVTLFRSATFIRICRFTVSMVSVCPS